MSPRNRRAAAADKAKAETKRYEVRIPLKKAAKPKKRGFLVFIPADPAKAIYREPFTEKTAPYERLRKAVGGLIQPVKLVYEERARDGYVNEEGLCQELPYNPRASQMWQAWGRKRGGCILAEMHLVGDAVLVFWEKIAPTSEGA